MRDRASSNNVAVAGLKLTYDMIDAPCFAHMMDNCGRKMETLVGSDLVSTMTALFSRSKAARAAFFDFSDTLNPDAGFHPLTVSQTRWFSEFEFVRQLHTNWPIFKAFLLSDDVAQEVGGALYMRARSMISAQPDLDNLVRVDIATMVDALTPVCAACYELEGDGAMLFSAYDIVERVRRHLDSIGNFPSVAQLAPGVFAMNPVPDNQFQNLIDRANRALEPVVRYFAEKVTANHVQTLAPPPYGNLRELCRVARWFNPKHMHPLVTANQPLGINVQELTSAVGPGFLTLNQVCFFKSTGFFSSPIVHLLHFRSSRWGGSGPPTRWNSATILKPYSTMSHCQTAPSGALVCVHGGRRCPSGNTAAPCGWRFSRCCWLYSPPRLPSNAFSPWLRPPSPQAKPHTCSKMCFGLLL